MKGSPTRRDPREELRELNRLYADLDDGVIGLPEAIKGMRRVSRLTQAEFAAHRGISVQALKQIEQGRGNPTVETLNKIAAIFGLEVGLRPKRRPGPPRRTDASFLVQRRSDGKYFFELTAPNGQIVLSSEVYTSIAAARKAIESIRLNATDDTRYRRERSTTGQPYFVLTAGNGEIIGVSERFSNESALEQARRLVADSAANATIKERAFD